MSEPASVSGSGPIDPSHNENLRTNKTSSEFLEAIKQGGKREEGQIDGDVQLLSPKASELRGIIDRILEAEKNLSQEGQKEFWKGLDKELGTKKVDAAIEQLEKYEVVIEKFNDLADSMDVISDWGREAFRLQKTLERLMDDPDFPFQGELKEIELALHRMDNAPSVFETDSEVSVEEESEWSVSDYDFDSVVDEPPAPKKGIFSRIASFVKSRFPNR